MKEQDPDSKGPEKPKKTTKKRAAKKVTPKKIVNDVVPAEPTEDQEFINDLLQNSIDQYKKLVDREASDYRDELGQLQNQITEYMDDFVLIGHTVNEKRVVMRYAPSPRGYDGLKELTREYLMRMVMNDPIEGGPGGPTEEPPF